MSISFDVVSFRTTSNIGELLGMIINEARGIKAVEEDNLTFFGILGQLREVVFPVETVHEFNPA